ncbi:helix-turn-helix domain-containing protein [Trinickia sp.]|uniref:helix-turn-helix domain-containing protein n=1 Tax=Trinickia sp. TaxID=2571163 RepID=UPI003F7D0CE5
MRSISPVIIGLRVKIARDALRMTQDDLSTAIGFNDRQTLSDIENGKRSVSDDELLKFSDLLDQDLEYFIDPFSVVGEAQYSWRASKDVPEEVLNRFEEKAAGWVGLLRWLRAHSPADRSALGFSLRLDARSSFEQAQQSAENLVSEFRLGPVPARKLVDYVETTLDIPVLFVDTNEELCDIKGTISGAACHLSELGVVLVNRRENAARRNFDLAHELFHVLTWERMVPQHRESNSLSDRSTALSRRIEQLADNFAAALLMPCSSLDAFIDPERAKDAGHLADVAHKLCVSAEALGWRLKSLGRIDDAARVALGAVRRQANAEEVPKPFSRSFVGELHVALDRGRLTARKAAQTLGMSLGDLSGLFTAYELHDPFKS